MKSGGPTFAAPCGALVGALAGVGAAVLEILVTFASTTGSMTGAADLFVSSAEGVRFAWTLVGLGLGAGAVLGAACGLLTLGGGWAVTLLGRGPRAVGRVVGTVLLAPLAWTAMEAASGSGMRRVPGRLAIAAIAALGATALCGLAARALAAWLTGASARRRNGTALVALALFGFLATMDRAVLPRLYPWLHAWLGALSVLCLAGAILLASGGLGRRILFVQALGTGLLLAGGIVGSSALWVLMRTENLRYVLAEDAPHGGRLLALAIAMGARPALPEGGVPRGFSEAAGRGGALPILPVATTDVFLVTVDALRADHLGAYGYGRPTSPRLDALAREAVVFERAYTPTPHTSYAIASLLTGKYVRSLVRLGVDLEGQETLADVLRGRGFETAAFYPRAVFFIDRERFAAMEARRAGFEWVKVGNETARERTAQVLQFLDRPRRGPRLVWAHYFEPHEPYRPAADAPRFGRAAMDLYDGEIATVDRALTPLLDRIDRDFPEAVVVVTADHGEEFGEHGGRYHGTTVYDEQVRVPLLVRAPGLSPRRVREPVDLVDVAGTLLALLDVPASPRLRSDDLRPLLVGQRDPHARAFTETDEWLAAIDESGKLACRVQEAACKLFDLARDPGERHGGPAAGEGAARLRRALSAWAASHARWEERPPQAQGPWPEPLRRAVLGDATAGPQVAVLLRTGSVEVRRRSAEALGDLGATAAAEALAVSLADEDALVREIAALSLARLRDERGRPLLEAGLRAEVVSTRRRAALGLGALGDVRGAPILLELLSDEGWPLEDRRRALADLAAIRDPSTVPGLVAALPVLRTRPAVIEALGRIGDRRAVGPLVTLLGTDRYAHHKAAAVRALGVLGDPMALRAILHAAAADEPPPDVAWAAAQLGGPVVDLAREQPAGWQCSEQGCAPGVSALPVPERLLRGARRAIVRVHAAADGGRIALRSGGREVGEHPLVRGPSEAVFELSSDGEGEPALLHVRVDPPETEVTIREVLLVAADLFPSEDP